jgi:hypothetical protein
MGGILKEARTSFSRLCSFPIGRHASVMLVALVALAWSSPGFCDEIPDAARHGDR